MNHSDGGIRPLAFLHEQKRERLAHDHDAAKKDDVRAGDVDLTFDEQSLHAERCAGNKSAWIVERELGHIFWMKTVDIFTRIKRTNDFRFVDLLGRRRLHENSVDCRLAIQ